MTERQNVEIDYCPQCRGVWLDRGEIDKIIERSLDQGPPRAAWSERPAGDQGRYEADPDEHRRPYEHRGHRRKSWLSDFFD
jgi:Zn-finger nucleic acid-binding protein